jgi:hypothetical protein
VELLYVDAHVLEGRDNITQELGDLGVGVIPRNRPGMAIGSERAVAGDVIARVEAAGAVEALDKEKLDLESEKKVQMVLGSELYCALKKGARA